MFLLSQTNDECVKRPQEDSRMEERLRVSKMKAKEENENESNILTIYNWLQRDTFYRFSLHQIVSIGAKAYSNLLPRWAKWLCNCEDQRLDRPQLLSDSSAGPKPLAR